MPHDRVQKILKQHEMMCRVGDRADGGGAMGTRLVQGAVSLNPNSSNLPGSTVLQKLVDGIGGWALLLALVGLIIGAATWAIGAHSQNYQQSYNGRRAVLVSALAALIIGAAPAVINFLFGSGTQIHSPLG
jgi:MFS family permease